MTFFPPSRATLVVASLTGVLAACGPGGRADAGPDASRCTIDTVDPATRIDLESPIFDAELSEDVLHLLIYGLVTGFDAVAVGDGSIVVGGHGEGRGPVTFQSRHHTDGRIELVREGPPGPADFTARDGALLLTADDRLLPEGEVRRFHVGLWDLDGSGLLASVAEPLARQDCRPVSRHTPVLSAGRILTLAGPCGPQTVAERWAQMGTELSRASGPFDIPEPYDRGFAGARATEADGVGGVFWVGQPALLDREERTDRAVVVGHWDGETEPRISETLGPVGTTTDFTRGFMHPSGDFIAMGNHIVEGFSRTYVARVRPDASFAWVWESPRGFFSGPNWPTAAITGDGDLVVLLMEPAVRRGFFMMRLSAEGVPASEEPVQIWEEDFFQFTITEGGLLAAGHADGSFHVVWSDADTLRIMRFSRDGTPLWPPERRFFGGGTNFFEIQMFPDTEGGVWLVWNNAGQDGNVQHLDSSGWPLYWRWNFRDCGQYAAVIARPSPDAEPLIYESERHPGIRPFTP